MHIIQAQKKLLGGILLVNSFSSDRAGLKSHIQYFSDWNVKSVTQRDSL
jgi:hypothetical protein